MQADASQLDGIRELHVNVPPVSLFDYPLVASGGPVTCYRTALAIGEDDNGRPTTVWLVMLMSNRQTSRGDSLAATDQFTSWVRPTITPRRYPESIVATTDWHQL